jgi:hypothetical protein
LGRGLLFPITERVARDDQLDQIAKPVTPGG